MKKIHIIIFSLLLLASGCSEDFLVKVPKDQLAETTTFTTNSNFETYSWGFYSYFSGFYVGTLDSEKHGDLGIQSNGSQGSDWLWQRMIVPSASSTWTIPYRNIKRVNLMLDNIDKSQLTDGEKDHWRSVGYFFRAHEYLKLLKAYGAVPWVDHVLTDKDIEMLYGPRTPRDEVAQNMLDDLKWAELHINPNGNGANTVNTNVVRALISHFGLFEGTWRKYHGLGGEEQYLQASADASAHLIADFPNLHSNYDEVFNSESLNGVDGIILYKQYEFTQLEHYLTSRHRNSAGNWDLTKKAVDSYLCLDGQTRWTSPMFDGDHDAYDEFRNRDRRLYFTTVPPFRVDTDGKNQMTWKFDPDPKHREYIDLMNTLSDDKHKLLPTLNWRGLVVKTEPHFRKYNEGQGFNASYTGYRSHKNYNTLAMIQNKDFCDAPIYRMGEIMVNYAEAMQELGQFTQLIADQTINKLRARGQVAPLDIAAIVEDPTRDATVDPVMWEIRRERAVELMYEGFRFNDLRRWRKVDEYAGVEKLGRYVVNANYGNKLPIQGGAAEGYISPYGVPPGFPDYYYLFPIPSDQIVLNPELKQNPGWTTDSEE